MIQGNLDLGTQWRWEFYGRNLETYLRLTERALRESAPELVVWPENALTFFLDDEPLYQRAIAAVLAPSGAQLVTGGPRVVVAADPVYYNSVFLLSPGGSVLGRYDKQRLVPFAEYFPFRALDFLRRRPSSTPSGASRRARTSSPAPPSPARSSRAPRSHPTAGSVTCSHSPARSPPSRPGSHARFACALAARDGRP